MSFVLLHGGQTSLLASDTPVIKASEAEPIRDAVAIIAEAERLLVDARKEQRDARSSARQDGLAEGIAAVRDEVAREIARFATELAVQQRRRDEELADAAMAAVRAILGEIAPEVLGPALVQQAIAGFANGETVRLEVSPALATHLRDRLGTHVDLIENPALGPLDCELRLASGTIRAGLDVQLDALAERWGLPPGNGR